MQLKKPFHEAVAEKLIEQLKTGTAPWQKPWRPGDPNMWLPMNPSTGKRYRGINAVYLMAQGRSDPRWMTYRQASAAGAQVRRGEKGTTVQYWKFTEEQDRLDDQGRPVRDDNGKIIKDTVKLERPRAFFSTVFNAEQIDGLPQRHRAAEDQKWDAVERADTILKNSEAKITHAPGDRAFYRPSSDSITLPERSQFDSADRYYATALHELGHWTGHPSRLARDLSHPFGSEGYAREELRAEIASMIMGDELGIGHDPGQHAAYVGSWIKTLRDDPAEIFRASADAEKIHRYVMAFENKLVHEQDTQKTVGTGDADVVKELRKVRLMQGKEDAAIIKELGDVSQKVLGFTLPADWNGGVLVQGCVMRDEHTVESVPDDVEAQFFGVYARREDGTVSHLADFDTRVQAEDVAKRLVMLDLEAREPSSLRNSVTDHLASQERPDSVPVPQSTQREYINVPYKEKEEAKALGAKWDRKQQSWYVPSNIDLSLFDKWKNVAGTDTEGHGLKNGDQEALKGERQYLAVPYTERAEARAAGALWDKVAKSWYVGPRADMAKLERWTPERVSAQQGPSMTPQEEFAEAMRSVGLRVEGDHPIMDGRPHRVPVEGGKRGAADGFYVGHLDGHPAGKIINNKTGADLTWKSKGYSMSDQEKARVQAEAAGKLAKRAAEQDRIHEATAQRVRRQLSDLLPVQSLTPYLKAKGIEAHDGVFTDNQGQKTFIPAFDVHGKQWSMQYIDEAGNKRFAKESRKSGCFHPVGGMNALDQAPIVVVAEGYATAATLAETLGHATVAAFDSGNLMAVASALHERYPDKQMVIAGDDDRHLEMTQGVNPGRSKAEAAAAAVGGTAWFPTFSADEHYPKNLNPVTPDAYRVHESAKRRIDAASEEGMPLSTEEAGRLRKLLLEPAQIDAIDVMKRHTDFNDLAVRSKFGREGLERQGRAMVSSLANAGQTKTKQVREDLVQQQQNRKRRGIRIG